MRSTLLCACFLILSSSPNTFAEDKADGKWVQLFNGKNLDGWTPKITGYKLGENFGNTFRVEGGLLKVRYDGYEKFDGKFGHLFYKSPYSHYVMRVEYRFVDKQVAGGPGWALRNSGVMIHGQPAASMKKDQKFPVSIEVQLLGGDGKAKRTNANLCTPGTNVVMKDKLIKQHCISSKSKTYHGDKWVTVEIEVRGDEVIRHKIEGETVIEYNKPQLDERDNDAKALIEKQGGNKLLTGGSISLQSESHPIDFRKVEIMNLEKK